MPLPAQCDTAALRSRLRDALTRAHARAIEDDGALIVFRTAQVVLLNYREPLKMIDRGWLLVEDGILRYSFTIVLAPEFRLLLDIAIAVMIGLATRSAGWGTATFVAEIAVYGVDFGIARRVLRRFLENVLSSTSGATLT